MAKTTAFETKDVYYQLDKLKTTFESLLDDAGRSLGELTITKSKNRTLLEEAKINFAKSRQAIFALAELRNRLGWIKRHEIDLVGENE